MLSIFDHGAPAPCPAPFNLAQHVLAKADVMGAKPALIIAGPERTETLSYAALKQAVLGVAQGLLDQGLTPGARLMMRIGNSVDFPIVYLAAIAAGMVAVPTSAQLTAAELAPLYDLIKPQLVVHDGQAALGQPDCAVLTTDVLDAWKSGPQAAFHLGDPNRLAYIVFTSGTSARPRAVMHGHRAIWARQMMHTGWYGLTEADRLLHAGAFNWTFTLGAGLLDPWSLGATSLIPAPGVQLEALPLLLHRHKATLLAAAPGVYRKMLKGGRLPALPHLRHGLSAGEKLPEPLRRDWQAATGTALHEAFGMSECSTFISGSPSAPAQTGTLGRPQPGRRVAIVGAGGPVALGTAGEIAVHRDDPGLMLGYLDAPEATAARFRGDWFLTGDLGRIAADGSITYLGRADDIMNAGGFRVSPLEVEAALMGFDGLTGVAVTDIAVKPGTSIIAAFYTADRDVNVAALEAFANSVLARYKQPRLYRRLPQLPVNANGKLARKALQTMYEAQDDSNTGKA
ncbi:class I adenylate-forming enzyme family protein [Cognatishimia sp. SS12]|uniref:class I adenylate-forming enzyme family protein n=1 Tax=Cognatishimia sp. SS12 TaxID=2979465 RepID=UPI00232E1301|nr:class I adenylate-forming enzyme family protein [Cognatishimia sp. SS12]MDC0737133.1 class I adenylate-forming enzyme family protein [Cognatishimia sp. SS12]